MGAERNDTVQWSDEGVCHLVYNNTADRSIPKKKKKAEEEKTVIMKMCIAGANVAAVGRKRKEKPITRRRLDQQRETT